MAEQPDPNELPAFDPRSASHYRSVFGAVPTSVAIIAALHGGGPVGMSVGSFVSVSLDPPIVGFFIAQSSTTWPRIREVGRFTASVLASSQAETSNLFAARDRDRFSGCSWSDNRASGPVIDGSVAWFDCAIHSTTAAGDHDLVLGHVDAMWATAVPDPLVFHSGTYRGFVPL